MIESKLKWKKATRKAKVVESQSNLDSSNESKSYTKYGLKLPLNKYPTYGEVHFTLSAYDIKNTLIQNSPYVTISLPEVSLVPS